MICIIHDKQLFLSSASMCFYDGYVTDSRLDVLLELAIYVRNWFVFAAGGPFGGRLEGKREMENQRNELEGRGQ